MNKLTPVSPPPAQLPIMESFYTIQGEGFHQGKAAYFVRLAGCDVGCVWCDVKESWDVSGYPVLSVEEIARQTAGSPSEIVVVTGGEPFTYDLFRLTEALKAQNKKTHVETSGAYPLTGSWDWICFSPKKFKAPLDEFFEKAHELKVVIYNKADFKWAQELAKKMNPGAKLFVQPEWSKSSKIMAEVVKFVKENPHWEISLQIHKFMNVP